MNGEEWNEMKSIEMKTERNNIERKKKEERRKKKDE